MSIELPLQQKLTPVGLASNPTIHVTVRAPTADRIYAFLLDTGTDFSGAPRRLACQTGRDWQMLPKAQVLGVEHGGVRARLGPLPLYSVDIALTVRCLFVGAPRVPFILGRADFLDPFVLTMGPAQHRIILTELP